MRCDFFFFGDDLVELVPATFPWVEPDVGVADFDFEVVEVFGLDLSFFDVD